MDFGLCINNYPGCWDDAAFAEQHGFATAGFVDSPMLAGDPFVAIALTGQKTSTLRVGTLLNIPNMRLAPVTAAALSTVNHIAPGRVFFGTGTGFSGRMTFNLPPVTLAKTRNRLNDIRALLAGDEVLHREDGKENLIRWTNKDVVRHNAEHVIPFYMGADGPRALETAGAIADGWCATLALQGARVMDNAPEVFGTALEVVKASALKHGRNFDDAYTLWTTAICVLEPGESAVSPRALAQVGPYAIFACHSYACNPEILPFLAPEVQERIDIYEKAVLAHLGVPRERFYQEVHAGHLEYLLEGEAEVLTEEIIRLFSLTRTAEEIAYQLQQMEARGLKNVTFAIPPRQTREVIVDVETKVMPILAPSTV